MIDKLLLYKALKNKSGAEISASGNPATLPGTLKNNPMNEMKVFGWSKQESTTGKNLFDFSRLVSDGVNVMDYEKQTITIPAKTNNTGYNQTLRDLCPGITPGTYVFSAKNSNPESFVGSYFLEIAKDFPINTPIELTDELLDNHIAWYNNPDSEIENAISEIQIEAGDTATAYEPYTGGQPSPNPEYPQEIVSSGMKWSTGKNLFSGFVFGGTSSRAENGIITKEEGTLYIRSDYIPCEVGKHYVYNIPDGWRRSQTVFCNSDKKYIGTPKNPQSFNVPEDTAYFAFQIAKTDTTPIYQADLEAVSKLVQVEQADTCTEYEPYTGGVPKLHGDKIDLEVHGKNLFDLKYASDIKNWGVGSYRYIPYYVGKKNKVSVSYSEKLPLGREFYAAIGPEKGGVQQVYF